MMHHIKGISLSFLSLDLFVSAIFLIHTTAQWSHCGYPCSFCTFHHMRCRVLTHTLHSLNFSHLLLSLAVIQ